MLPMEFCIWSKPVVRHSRPCCCPSMLQTVIAPLCPPPRAEAKDPSSVAHIATVCVRGPTRRHEDSSVQTHRHGSAQGGDCRPVVYGGAPVYHRVEGQRRIVVGQVEAVEYLAWYRRTGKVGGVPV